MPGPMPQEEGKTTIRSSRVGRWFAVGTIVTLVVGGALVGRFRASMAASAIPLAASQTKRSANDSLAYAPSGSRVTVRVLNATTTRGLARRATMSLRAYGYDVVDYDSDTKRRGSATRIIAHTGKDDIAKRIQRALGAGAIETASPDGSRYVDFTVLLGSDWKAPAQPFRP